MNTAAILEHKVRIGAGLVFTAALALLIHTGNLLIAPLALASLPAALQLPRLTSFSESLTSRLHSFHQSLQQSSSKGSWILRPFTAGALLLINKTSGIENPHVRAGVQLGSVALFASFFVFAAIMAVTAIIYLVLFLIAIAFAIIFGMGALGAAGSSSGSSSASVQPKGHKIVERLKGTRITNAGFLGDYPSGLRVGHDGRLIQEGFLDSPTGYRIADDGRIIKEGFLDSSTGFRINEDGRIVKEGFFDSPTGIRIKEDGRVVEEGFFDRDTGTRFK